MKGALVELGNNPDNSLAVAVCQGEEGCFLVIMVQYAKTGFKSRGEVACESMAQAQSLAFLLTGNDIFQEDLS